MSIGPGKYSTAPHGSPELEARRQVIDELFDHMANKRMDEAVAMCAADLWMEVPWQAPGMLRKCAGPGELRKLFAWVEESFEPFNLKASEYWTIAPNGLLVKYATDAVYLKNGRPYQNAYLGVFWFDEDGKIAEWYEYCNPITVLYAFGR